MKDRVLDINEIFEQFYAQYASMKEAVKDKIYDELTYEIDLGIKTFKRTEIATYVWNAVNSLAFGCIDALV